MIKIINQYLESNKTLIWPIYQEDDICPKFVEKIGNGLNEVVDKKSHTQTIIYPLGKLKHTKIIFLGLGERSKLDQNVFTEVFGRMMGSLKEEAVIFVDHLAKDGLSKADIAFLSVESYLLSTYHFKKINEKEQENKLVEVVIEGDYQKEFEKATIYANAINHARDLSNTPSNMMKPIDLAKYAESLAKELAVKCTILDNTELKKIGAGAILAVNQGSTEEARLIVLKYNGANDLPYTALVGKGLTFDSGGYNLKTNGGAGMKYDMCGAANMISAFEIAVRMKYPVNLYAVIPATENMINGSGYKVDDVILSLSGKLIEVTNTDAEGRLILCDAITYACQLGAKRIIDAATLTGAIGRALGNEYTGVFTNSKHYYDQFYEASKLAMEPIWQMPVSDSYTALLKNSLTADIVNSVPNSAGASVAACFLKEFVEEGVEWIHLDIAATATTSKPLPLMPLGATGVMIRTIAYLLEKDR